jgi:hypothetical protein
MHDVIGPLQGSIEDHRRLLAVEPPLTPDQLAATAAIVRGRIEDLTEAAAKLVPLDVAASGGVERPGGEG